MNKILSILLFFLFFHTFCCAQCNRKTRKEIKRTIENSDLDKKSQIAFFHGTVLDAGSVNYKCYFPASYYSNKYSIEIATQSNLNNKNIDSLADLKKADAISKNVSYLISEKIKRIFKMDSVLVYFKDAEVKGFEKIKGKLDSINVKNNTDKSTFSTYNRHAINYLRKKCKISAEGLSANESAINAFVAQENLRTQKMESAHEQYLSIIRELRLNDSLDMKQDYTGDMIINKIKDDLIKLTDIKGKSRREYLPINITAERVGPNGEDLLIHWSMLLDTSFAFALGDYKTDKMDYQIKQFAIFIYNNSFGEKLDVDFSFLGLADANPVGQTLIYNRAIQAGDVRDEFRMGTNVDIIDSKTVPVMHIIKLGTSINNIELAMLRCYNAYKITNEKMNGSQGKIRYLRKDAIAYVGDIKEKKGLQFRRIEIVVRIYKFALKDRNGRKIPITTVQKHNWKPMSNTVLNIQDGKENK